MIIRKRNTKNKFGFDDENTKNIFRSKKTNNQNKKYCTHLPLKRAKTKWKIIARMGFYFNKKINLIKIAVAYFDFIRNT